jgi:uncharacterized protein YndB with AHSA1/START domain
MSEVSLVRRIAAPPAIVFEALVTAEGMASWWGPDDFPAVSAEADAQVGGRFRVRFRTADGLEHECAGEFLEIERPERLVMSWRWILNGFLDEHGKVSRLEIRLRSIEGGTELTLVHAQLCSEDSARSHKGGWDGALKKLTRRFPLRSMTGGGRGAWAGALCVVTAAMVWSQGVAAHDDPYPTMAPISQYMIASRAEEIRLAKSAAPASVADHAELLVLGAHGYETAVKGTNGFVCFVGRSWDVSFVDPQFWNPKIRSPQCDNAVSVRSVLPRYLTRTTRVLSGVSKAEMQKREAAEWLSGTLKAPEPGAVSYMMSKDGYLNDAAGGPWHPHVMFFAPRTDSAAWGADLPGSPLMSDSTSYEQTTIFFVIVPKWSDGTPGPAS